MSKCNAMNMLQYERYAVKAALTLMNNLDTKYIDTNTTDTQPQRRPEVTTSRHTAPAAFQHLMDS